MDVNMIWTTAQSETGAGWTLVSRHPVEDLPELLARTDDGLVWVDIPEVDEEAERVLAEVFCFHPLAIKDCKERNHVPKVHVYPGYVFLVLHAPFAGQAGHVHYIELDQFIGKNFLVTVHGPLNPAVDKAVANVEVASLFHRLQEGRVRPQHPYELPHGMVSALTARLRKYTEALTQEVWSLEQRVTAGHLGDAEQFLEEMFRTRHGLLTVETMAALSREVYARMAKIEVFGPGRGQFWSRTASTSSPGCVRWCTGRRITCRAPSSSTRPGRTPR